MTALRVPFTRAGFRAEPKLLPVAQMGFLLLACHARARHGRDAGVAPFARLADNGLPWDGWSGLGSAARSGRFPA